ncbi:MAG: HEAT repeat domain-containing protein [Deltaproteobacteria bacterium]|nr:HEAT repeat domain-containing protein [Deltaproteobacteria bacterium]
MHKGSSFVVRVKDGLLTVKVRNIPLKRVLEEIAGQTKIKLVFNGPSNAMISSDFSGFPLEKGLRRLIRGMNYACIYGSEETKRGRSEIREIIIYSEAEERPFRAVRPPMITPKRQAPEKPEETPPESLFDALRDEDPEIRKGAVARLSRFKKDEDEEVRKAAAEALKVLRGRPDLPSAD